MKEHDDEAEDKETTSSLEKGADTECQLQIRLGPHVPAWRVPRRWWKVRWTDVGFQVVDLGRKETNMQRQRRETGQEKESEDRKNANTQSC